MKNISSSNEKIYYGGNIFTLDRRFRADYLVTENGKIRGAGTGTPPNIVSGNVEKINLRGRTLLPAFIDSHSHLSACAYRLLQPSLFDCTSNEDIFRTLSRFISDNRIPAGEWITANNYTPASKEARLIAETLDKCAPNNPLVVQYTSGHMGIFNSEAMKLLGINANTPPSNGGFIERKEDGTPTGYMEESDFIPRLRRIPAPPREKLLSAFEKAQNLYFSHGIVTIQEGLAVKEFIPLYKALTEKTLLRADVVAYPERAAFGAYTDAFPRALKRYEKNFKLGGLKLISDGSPQGRTAWLRTPYRDESGTLDKDGFCGYPSVTKEELTETVRFASEKELQLLVHCNGDKAAEAFIRAELEYGRPDLRPVMIHAQLLAPDQLNEVKRAGIIPSFFVAHVLYWGDVHLKNLGRERAERISPLHSALEKGLLFTLHQDSPVVAPDMLETIYCATVRKTKNGKILGEKERIGVREALRAVTVNAAHQYFEEKTTGTLEAGKRENLVILSDDPLTCPPEKIKDIAVEQTVKDGEILFKR